MHNIYRHTYTFSVHHLRFLHQVPIKFILQKNQKRVPAEIFQIRSRVTELCMPIGYCQSSPAKRIQYFLIICYLKDCFLFSLKHLLHIIYVISTFSLLVSDVVCVTDFRSVSCLNVANCVPCYYVCCVRISMF